MLKPTIAVTGLGCICAAGNSLEETMKTLYAGERKPVLPKNIKVNLEDNYPVLEVNYYFKDSDKNATRTSLLVQKAAQEAVEHAGFSHSQMQKLRVGICIGTTVGCTFNNESFYREFVKGGFPENDAFGIYLQNNPAEYLARKFGVKGPVATLANACSSGTDAIGMAKRWLENDLCDIAFAGGGDELSRITYLGFVSLLIASKESCRPFDRNRTGLNLGEGAGILLLEKKTSAEKRGTEILAEVAGFGTFADAYHPTAPHPNGIGLNRAILSSLIQAGISAEDVDFINAHGTSTPDNDKVEGRLIAHLFPKGVPVISTKGYTGHTLGAAGGIEAVFTVKALLDKQLPGTVGFVDADPDCMIKPEKKFIKLKAQIGISNSLAFGGNNSAVIFRRNE